MRKASLTIAFALLISMLAACAPAAPDDAGGDSFAGGEVSSGAGESDVIRLEGSISNVMKGVHGEILLVDAAIDYAELMRVLYPDGLVDAQGLDIPGVDNLEEARAEYVAEHTKAYAFKEGSLAETGLTPFWVTLSGASEKDYDCLFYKATVGEDSFIFPSEWGGQPCGFAANSGAGVYLAYTDTGIWRIDSQSMKADKISSDFYNGEQEIENHADLLWIGGVYISPDAAYAVYRTNRESPEFSPETSIWAVDLRTGEERQVLKPARNNDFVGYISEGHFVVGARADTRIVSLDAGETVPVTLPEIPNLFVDGVNGGIIVYSGYEEGSSDVTGYIGRVDLPTGALTVITESNNIRSSGSVFSPAGKTAAFGYVNDPMKGVVDVMLVDLTSGKKEILTNLLRDSARIQGEIYSVQWVSDDMLLVTSAAGGGDTSYLAAPVMR